MSISCHNYNGEKNNSYKISYELLSSPLWIGLPSDVPTDPQLETRHDADNILRCYEAIIITPVFSGVSYGKNGCKNDAGDILEPSAELHTASDYSPGPFNKVLIPRW